jgi:hypothetical protein
LFIAEGSDPNYAVLNVNASDADSGQNAEVRYSLLTPVEGFTVDQTTGTLHCNRSGIPASLMKQDIQLVVVATDSGQPALSSTVAVRIHVSDGGKARPRFSQDEYRWVTSDPSLLSSLFQSRNNPPDYHLFMESIKEYSHGKYICASFDHQKLFSF